MKRGERNKKDIIIMCLLLGFSYIFLAGGQISAKMASRTLDAPKTVTVLFAGGTYACFLLRGLLWVFLLRKIKLVVAYPLMSIGYVLVLVLSYFLFDEVITPGKAAGASLLVCGLLLISMGENRLPVKAKR